MRATSAVVLAIDRLGAGWIGPYGNTWLETPNFNRLAARSVLCETVIADSPRLDAAYRGYWTGCHSMEPVGSDTTSLAMLAQAGGAASLLLTDDSRLIEHPHASGFGERRVLSANEALRSATEIEQTGLYAFFDAVCDALRRHSSPGLLWLHSRGMRGPWDAPLDLRYQFADEDDPQPPDFVRPPEATLGRNADPDEQLGYVHAYAGQVTLVDMCLGMLLDALDEHPAGRETLLIVTSPRGYPLGEHLRVGTKDEALYGELLHVPLLVRFPDDEGALLRSRGIAQPREVFSVVAGSCGWETGKQSTLLQELESRTTVPPAIACSAGHDQRASRTPAWFMREWRAGEAFGRELFVKPDDHWEANEVSSRCEEVAELLAADLDRFESTAREGRLAESPQLAEVLCDIWR